MKKFDVFVWSSDFTEFRGEGLLARTFINNFFSDSNLSVKIVSNNGIFFYKKKIKIVKKYNSSLNFITKYFTLFYGIFLIWINYFKGKKVCYINYLPLWNFLIFLLLPKNITLGPMTGGEYRGEIVNISTFLRKKVFPILYFVSLRIIFIKYDKVIFSTDNLKKYLKITEINKCIFNFCLLFFKSRKKIKKNVDFLFYYRIHPQKANLFQETIIKRLYEKGFSIIVVGDRFIYRDIKSYVNIKREKVLRLLDRTKFSIISDENFFSLFSIDCIACNVVIFYNKNKTSYKKTLGLNNIVSINFDNLLYSVNKICKYFYYFKNKKISQKNNIKIIDFYKKKIMQRLF
jgi:hypothetical protein